MRTGQSPPTSMPSRWIRTSPPPGWSWRIESPARPAPMRCQWDPDLGSFTGGLHKLVGGSWVRVTDTAVLRLTSDTGTSLGFLVLVDSSVSGPVQSFSPGYEYWCWTGTAWPTTFRVKMTASSFKDLSLTGNNGAWERYPITALPENSNATTVPSPPTGAQLYQGYRAAASGTDQSFGYLIQKRTVDTSGDVTAATQDWFVGDPGPVSGGKRYIKLPTTPYPDYRFVERTSGTTGTFWKIAITHQAP